MGMLAKDSVWVCTLCESQSCSMALHRIAGMAGLATALGSSIEKAAEWSHAHALKGWLTLQAESTAPRCTTQCSALVRAS